MQCGIFVSYGGRQLIVSICHAVKLITRLKSRMRLPTSPPPLPLASPPNSNGHSHPVLVCLKKEKKKKKKARTPKCMHCEVSRGNFLICHSNDLLEQSEQCWGDCARRSGVCLCVIVLRRLAQHVSLRHFIFTSMTGEPFFFFPSPSNSLVRNGLCLLSLLSCPTEKRARECKVILLHFLQVCVCTRVITEGTLVEKRTDH